VLYKFYAIPLPLIQAVSNAALLVAYE